MRGRRGELIRRCVLFVIKLQFCVLLFLVLAAIVLLGYSSALALGCGGLIAILPAWGLASCYFAKQGVRYLWRTWLVLCLGEALKLIVTAGLFFLCLYYVHLAALPLMVGFISMIVLCTIGLFISSKQGH